MGDRQIITHTPHPVEPAMPSPTSTAIEASPTETVAVIINGTTVHVPIEELQRIGNFFTKPDGTASAPGVDGDDPKFGGSVLPPVRFAAHNSPAVDDLSAIFANNMLAELGQSHLPVIASPDGRVQLSRRDGTTAVSTVPKERFAATVGAETVEVQRIDPQGRYWRRVEKGTVKGWFVSLRNNFGDDFVFFVGSQPSGLYEAQVVKPNMDHLTGHARHMLVNGRVCLNSNFGTRTLTEMHGALAKWCLYIGAINRGIDPQFSK